MQFNAKVANRNAASRTRVCCGRKIAVSHSMPIHGRPLTMCLALLARHSEINVYHK